MRIHIKKNINLVIILIVFLMSSIIFVNGSIVEKQILLNEISSIETNGGARNVILHENIALVLDAADSNPEGVVIINITDPINPIKLFSLYDGGIPYELVVKDDLAYVADGSDGIEVINISNPENPYEINQYPVSSFSTDLEIVDNLLFAANWQEGLVVLDISNPLNLTKVAQYNAYSLNCVQLDISGSLICITDHRTEYTALRLLNISNPYSPQIISSLTLSQVDFWNPKIQGNYIYACNHHYDAGELQILNITNPTSIVKISEFDDGGSIFSVNFNESFGFVADYNDGVEILDISDPLNPLEIGEYFDGGHSIEIAIKNNLLYVADFDDGLEILEVRVITKVASGYLFALVPFSILMLALFYHIRKHIKTP